MRWVNEQRCYVHIPEFEAQLGDSFYFSVREMLGKYMKLSHNYFLPQPFSSLCSLNYLQHEIINKWTYVKECYDIDHLRIGMLTAYHREKESVLHNNRMSNIHRHWNLVIQSKSSLPDAVIALSSGSGIFCHSCICKKWIILNMGIVGL